MSERTERMSEVIRRELSTLIRREGKLEGLIITISSVETSPDLKNAYIYVSLIEESVGKGKMLSILNRFRPAWQADLGRRIGAKFTPRLNFRFDVAQERGDRVMLVMQEIEKKKASEGGGEEVSGEVSEGVIKEASEGVSEEAA